MTTVHADSDEGFFWEFNAINSSYILPGSAILVNSGTRRRIPGARAEKWRNTPV